MGLTDHPHIFSESQREPCEPLGLSTVEEEGALKDFRALSRHFSNNPRACTVPARTACLSRSLPQLLGKDLARGTPGYFGMLLQPCVSCKPALPRSQCWSLAEKLCFPGGGNLKEPGELTQVAREMERDSRTRAQNHDLWARGKGRTEIRIKTTYAFESHPCNPHVEKWAPRSKLDQNPLHADLGHRLNAKVILGSNVFSPSSLAPPSG